MSSEKSASAGVYFQGFPLSHTTQSNRLFGLTNEITLKWSAFKICFILALAKNSGLLWISTHVPLVYSMALVKDMKWSNNPAIHHHLIQKVISALRQKTKTAMQCFTYLVSKKFNYWFKRKNNDVYIWRTNFFFS